MAEKRDVRLQIFVTSEIDDKLETYSSVMGLSKNELVRYAISQLLLGYEESVKIVKEHYLEDKKSVVVSDERG